MTALLSPPPAWTPTIARLDDIHPGGCLFHVGSPNENFRIRRYGGERDFVKAMIDAIRPGESFFDIGASVGLVSVHARRRGARVTAFEPDPGIRARLFGNLSLNGIDDVHVVDWAVSDAAGQATLYTDGPHGTSPSLAASSGRDSVIVRTDTIDAALFAGALARPAVVKIDVEGAEVRVLRGMRGALAAPQRPRAIYLEVHPAMLEAMGESAAAVSALLNDCAYALVEEHARDEQLHQVWHAR